MSSQQIKSTITRQHEQGIKTTAADSARGWAALSICIAQVVDIHWEEMRCTLEILNGQGDDTRALTGVELLMPSMGNRHFMGGIPEIGDQCAVGWFAHDTRAGTAGKTPAILAWWPSIPWVKHDWHMTQGFSPEDNVMESNKKRQIVQNFYHRIRHKLRHYSPGNIGASSAQGADMVLDESVHLSNRRANEIIIRDQDQAIIMRSLQQFHAMSGARVYAGMVQRDARTLPREMFSDGIKWDANIQIDSKGNPYNPISGGDLFKNPIETGKLQPHPVFERESFTEFGVNIKGNRKNFEGSFPTHLDPYVFLYNSGFVDDEYDELNNESDVIYGGKSILRVGTKFGENAFNKGNAFTEYRIEMNHTTDGLLPVTEQTDGFDSDRASDKPGETNNAPFIEWVLGTPVGNDAFSTKGKEAYGIPIVPNRNGLGVATEKTPFANHAATLLRVTPVVSGVSDSFTSFTKGGKFRAKVSSPAGDSFQTTIVGGASLNVGGALNLRSSTSNLLTTNKASITSQGAMELSAEGSETGDDLAGDEPNVSVIIKGNKRVSIQSSTAVAVKAPIVDTQAGQVRIGADDAIELNSGASINILAADIKQVSTGSFNQVCGGPSGGLPIAGPARSVTITESPGTGGAGTPSDEYINAMGGRSETYIGPATNTKIITTGTDTTTILTGTKTDIVSGTSTILDASGHKFISPNGALIASSASIASISSGAVFLIGNTAVTISGQAVTIMAKGTSAGPIVCGSDIHPILGVPYSSFVIPRGHNLAPL